MNKFTLLFCFLAFLVQAQEWIYIDNPTLVLLDRPAGTADLIIDLTDEVGKEELLTVFVEDYGIPSDAVALETRILLTLTPLPDQTQQCNIVFYAKTPSVPMPVDPETGVIGNDAVDRDGTVTREISSGADSERPMEYAKLPVENGVVEMIWTAEHTIRKQFTRTVDRPCYRSIRVKILGFWLGDITRAPAIIP